MARLVIVAVTIVLLGVAAGLAAALVLPKTYGARAEILYSVGQDPQGDPLKQDQPGGARSSRAEAREGVRRSRAGRQRAGTQQQRGH
jgi:uncharacterized protein involved in exopolysaccharide biosynthesis